mgnify:FL=1
MSQTIAYPVDLHVHSRFSDGLFSPEELAARAVRAGIRQMALCDHDTLEGIQPMKRAAAASLLPGGERMRFFPSLELSTGDGNTHVLGYGADTENAVLLRTLEEIRRSRLTRMEEMLERLETLGIHLPEERRARLLVPGTGRAHLARELVGMGLVSTVAQAFDRYLDTGKPGYVPRKCPTALEGVALLKAAGAAPVLAHPYRLGLETAAMCSFLLSLKEAGLAGVEAWHPSANRTQAMELDRFARRNGLLVTGGSDFHGDANTQVSLGHMPSGWNTCREDAQLLFDFINH